MRDESGPDQKILAVPAIDPRFDRIHDLECPAPHWLRGIEAFLETYKKKATLEQDRMRVYRNVVVAIDGSQASEVAFARALELACSAGARLAVLGVEESVPIFAAGTGWAQPNGQLQTAVETAVDVAKRAGLEAEGRLLTGYPAEVIIRYCHEHGCDLVVLGANDRGIGPLGGTADKVVDLAACAVMVAR